MTQGRKGKGKGEGERVLPWEESRPPQDGLREPTRPFFYAFF